MKEYFSHDYNARSDRKMTKLIMKHGLSGIGAFWCILEMLYENDGILPTEYDRIAFELRTDNGLIRSVIEDFELFIIDGGNFYSESVNKRLKVRTDKSDKARENVQKRWDKYKGNTDVIQSNECRNTIKVKESKGKEIKGEDSKLNKSKSKIKIDNGDKSPVYKNCTDIYFEVYENKTGLKPSFSSTDGKYLKELISKIDNSIKQKNNGGSIEDALRYILKNMPKFYGERLDIKVINSKYDAIIAEIRSKSVDAKKDAWSNILAERERERQAAAQRG